VSLPIRRSDEAQRDVELQAEYYAQERDLQLALDFTHAVESAATALGSTPSLGPICQLKHAELGRLRKWRVDPPFDRHLIFYRVEADAVVVVRIIHGMRDLPRRLLNPPGVE
jgi:toxin ParE1/3/4